VSDQTDPTTQTLGEDAPDGAFEVEPSTTDDAADAAAEVDAAVEDAPVADDAAGATDEVAEAEVDEAEVDEAAEAAEDEDVDPVEEFKAGLRRAPGDWFVIHSYAGYENRVKTNLETRIQSLTMEDFIFQVEVPMEEVNEVKNGQRKLVPASGCPATCWSGWTSPTSRGAPCGTPRASPASSATPTSRCR